MVRYPSGWCVIRRDGALSVGRCVIRRDGALSVGMVRYPSGWCVVRRDGALSVGMVHYPSGWCVIHQGGLLWIGVNMRLGNPLSDMKFKVKSTPPIKYQLQECMELRPASRFAAVYC